jgi:glycerol-3-phosphate dehydrogenase (NAD(P)+)
MDAQDLQPIAILGAGSWGTALAMYLSRRQQTVRLWSIDPTEISAMLADGANERYLPGHRLPPTLLPTADLAEALA